MLGTKQPAEQGELVILASGPISARLVEAAREHGDEDLAATHLLSAPAA